MSKWFGYAATPLLAFSLMQSAHAETAPSSCPTHAHAYSVSLKHREGSGIGYNQGYTTLEGFFAPHTQQLLPFADLRGHVFDDGRLAANAGLGLRYLTSTCQIFGVNSYYDFRQTHHTSYHQVGAGLEWLGRVWELRANGYLPVGNKASHFFHSRFKRFSGHRILLKREQEFAMKGGNLEMGAHLMQKHNWDLFFGAGPYYFAGKYGQHAWGAEGRFSVRFKQYVTLELSSSYDRIFHTNVQGMLAFSLPFGPKVRLRKKGEGCFSSCSRPVLMRGRLVQPPVRQEIIVVDKHHKNSKAIDPLTGKPYFVWFVDNDPQGDGTFENPFGTLAQAETASSPHDIIYIFPGDGTFTGMDAGIVLQDFQRLWGSGVSQSLPTSVGRIKIPALSSSLPLITNLAGNGVTLANHNEVSGLHLVGSVPGALSIFGVSVTDATLIRNAITSAISQVDIGLVDVSGSVKIAHNTLTTTAVSSGSVGIFVDNPGTTVSAIEVSHNTFTGHGGGGSFFDLSGTTSTAVELLSNSYTAAPGFAGSVGALVSTGGAASLQALFSKNSFFEHETGSGAILSSDSSTVFFAIDYNTVSPGPDAMFGLLTVSSDFSSQTGTFVGNSVTRSGVVDLLAQNDGAGVFTVSFFNNRVSHGGEIPGPFGGGIGVATTMSGIMKATVRNNTCLDNQISGGVLGVTITTGTLCLDLTNNFSNSTPGYTLFNNLGTGVLNVESFNGTLSGVQTVNVGSISTTGPITFVPVGTCE